MSTNEKTNGAVQSESSKSSKALRLSKESVKVLNVRAGVKTGMSTNSTAGTSISLCSNTYRTFTG
jgi:hypothetical protein